MPDKKETPMEIKPEDLDIIEHNSPKPQPAPQPSPKPGPDDKDKLG